MNRKTKAKRAIVLMFVLGFLIVVCFLGFAVMVLFQSQHGITHSSIGLDEIRYTKEAGLRHGLWVWRYHYDWLPYQTTLTFNELKVVERVEVRVEDKDVTRKLDQNDIEILVYKKPWNP
jgi:hypothetical protein